jgi:hypothetical protein
MSSRIIPHCAIYSNRRFWLLQGSLFILLGAFGCGGSGQSVGGPTPTPTSTPSPTPTAFTAVNLGFIGTPPAAVAVQMGTGPFTTVAPPSPTGLTSFNVPVGISKYVVAYLCQTAGNHPTSSEFIIEATIQDSTSLKANCSGDVTFSSDSSPALGLLSGNMDATLFPSSQFVHISGKQGFSDSADLQGPFSASLPLGTNDVAFVLLDNGGNLSVLGTALGVKIFRNQTVPGAVNGGNTITFGSSDFPANQELNVNAPAGFVVNGQLTEVTYTTAGGTLFPLENGSSAVYQAVPPALVQSGDFYSYGSEAETAGGASALGIYQPASNGGGLFTLNLPDAWSSSHPPTTGPPIIFTFDYPGFLGIPVFAQRAKLSWGNQTLFTNFMTVTATANFQQGANTISIPDPSVVGQGFFTCCPSGVLTVWSASILGATAPLPIVGSDFKSISISGKVLPVGSSAAFVQVSGSFTSP